MPPHVIAAKNQSRCRPTTRQKSEASERHAARCTRGRQYLQPTTTISPRARAREALLLFFACEGVREGGTEWEKGSNADRVRVRATGRRRRRRRLLQLRPSGPVQRAGDKLRVVVVSAAGK